MMKGCLIEVDEDRLSNPCWSKRKCKEEGKLDKARKRFQVPSPPRRYSALSSEACQLVFKAQVWKARVFKSEMLELTHVIWGVDQQKWIGSELGGGEERRLGLERRKRVSIPDRKGNVDGGWVM